MRLEQAQQWAGAALRDTSKSYSYPNNNRGKISVVGLPVRSSVKARYRCTWSNLAIDWTQGDHMKLELKRNCSRTSLLNPKGLKRV